MARELNLQEGRPGRIAASTSSRRLLLRVLATAAVAACVALPAWVEARRLERRAVAVQDALGKVGTEGLVVRREGTAAEVFEWIRSVEREAPAGRGALRLDVVATDEGAPRLIAEVLDGEAIRREER